MEFKIFYSWQSDRPNSTNRGFIQKALEQAAREIEQDDSISVEPVIDRDTQGVPGSPDIVDAILEKIDNCDIFACDVTLINQSTDSRLTPNPNVLIELGYALKRLGWNRIILISNTAFGEVEDLPFDLRMKRILTYSAREDEEDRSSPRNLLKRFLITAIKEIINQAPLDYDARSEESVLPSAEDENWLEQMRQMALGDFSNSGFTGYVEAYSLLSVPLTEVSNIQIIDAVSSSKINTFGWPIGAMGRNTDYMKPKPLSDGVVNSISPPDRESFDFWAIRKDGSFYLLKSFFEDKSEKNIFYYNIRIARTAEMLMFLSRLYNQLGADINAKIFFGLNHYGLKNRYISATGGRITRGPYGPVIQNEIFSKIEVNLDSLDQSISSLVSELLSPVFSLFDFFELPQNIYDEIVESFKRGRVT